MIAAIVVQIVVAPTAVLVAAMVPQGRNKLATELRNYGANLKFLKTDCPGQSWTRPGQSGTVRDSPGHGFLNLTPQEPK